MSSAIKKSKTLTAGAGRGAPAEGGLGAGGGASTIAIELLVLSSYSGASSTYALRGTGVVDCGIWTDLRDCFDGFSL